MRNHTHPEEIVLRTLAAARISEEVGIFLGDGHIMLRECFRVKPSLIPFSGMEVHENFLLIFGRDLLPPSNMLKIASLIGLGAFLIMETKESAILFRQIQR
jgi:hypothetical protein